MPGQIVGISVVVHMLGVFVRSDNVMDFETTINFRRAAHPERGGFHQQRQAFVSHKGIIVRRLPVSDDGPGNVRHDVVFRQRGGHLLTRAGSDVDSRELRRLFQPAGGAFPWKQRAGPAVATGFFPRPGQVEPTIAQQATGDLRSREEMERQQENFGIPEDVAFIPLARQPFGGDTASLIMGWRHGRQMPDGVIQRHLILMFRRLHLHPSIAPDLLPGTRRTLKQGVVASCRTDLKIGQRVSGERGLRQCFITAMCHPDDFFKRDSVTLRNRQRMMNAEATIFSSEAAVALR